MRHHLQTIIRKSTSPYVISPASPYSYYLTCITIQLLSHLHYRTAIILPASPYSYYLICITVQLLSHLHHRTAIISPASPCSYYLTCITIHPVITMRSTIIANIGMRRSIRRPAMSISGTCDDIATVNISAINLIYYKCDRSMSHQRSVLLFRSVCFYFFCRTCKR